MSPVTSALPSDWLSAYESNIHSQFGEDGILAEILSILPPAKERWCVEFGAWDGTHLSNTAALVERDGYGAVLIEANAQRYAELAAKHRGRNNLICINSYVTADGEGSLDRLLASTPLPRDFDVLSIDIDGNDYHVWKAVENYKPRVVVIEYNPTIPDEVYFVQPYSCKVQQGASIRALAELAQEKGYEPVSITTANLICVDGEYYSQFGITDNSVGILRKNRSLITYIFSGYDGSVHLSGNAGLPWHGIPYSQSRLQVLPKYLQHYPYNYSIFARLRFKILKHWLRRKK